MDTNGILALIGIVIAIVIVVIQQMYPTIPKYIGWPIIAIFLIASVMFISPTHISVIWEICIVVGLVLGATAISLFYWKNRGNSPRRTDAIIQSYPHKAEAYAIHKKIIELTTKLWETKDKFSNDEDLQKNPEIQHIMDELQIEINNLGHLINKREFDIWAEDLMRVYSKFLRFHMPVHDEWGEWGRARINTKFRYYINKVKG